MTVESMIALNLMLMGVPYRVAKVAAAALMELEGN